MSAEQAQQGAAGARLTMADIERLYRELGPKLHQFIRRQVAEPALAADLLQDVFVRLIRAGVEVRSDGELRSYLYRTATSVIAEYYRVRKLRGTVPLVPEDSDFEPALQVPAQEESLGALSKAQLERGFGELSVRDRTLLWLAYVEEMNHADIAAGVGIGAASVKVMLFRARERLAAALRALGLSPEEVL